MNNPGYDKENGWAQKLHTDPSMYSKNIPNGQMAKGLPGCYHVNLSVNAWNKQAQRPHDDPFNFAHRKVSGQDLYETR